MTWSPGGHNNWFAVNNSGSKFQVRFNHRASKLYENFDDAADNAAQLLHKEWGHRPLYLALSGGIDSELTARILLKNKISFTPVILKIADLNQFETWYAEYWCFKNNVTPVILEYSVEQFSKELTKFAPKLKQIKNFEQAPMLLIYDHVYQLGGFCIYSGGDINLDFDHKKFYCCSLDFISNLIDIGQHPTSFFMYTPEIALSYINQFDILQNEQYNKLKFYHVPPRPKIDYIHNILNNKTLKNKKDQLYYVLKIKKPEEDKHWYGTKEQLVQNLQP